MQIINIWMWLTGGRPMRRGEFLFVDVVSKEPVYDYYDFFGRSWMASGSWSLFRVENIPYPKGYS